MALYPSTVQSAIPQLWAEELQRALRRVLVYANVCNRKYEGILKEKGDSVRIQTVADISIGAYTRNTDVSLQTLTTTDIVLIADQGRTFGFKYDDVDDVQALQGIMEEAMSRAAYNMRVEVDTYVAGILQDGVQAANQLTAATSVGTGAGDDDAFEILVDLAVTLSNNFVPEDGRWCVVPPWYAGVLKKDPRRSSFGTPENVSQYGEGILGIDTVSGLRVYVSTNTPDGGTPGSKTIIAGYDDAATFAEQVTKFKQVEAPTGFYTNNFGLMVYGAKVTRPYALASIDVTEA